MRGKPGAVHYLPRNDSVWTPAAVIFLDSETRTVQAGPAETEVLRCWAGERVFRRHRRRTGEIDQAHGFDAASAAQAVDRWACSDKSTWLYAHNVAFDLITTRLAEGLAELGWELSSRHAVSGHAPWLVLHKGQQRRSSATGRRSDRSGNPGTKWQHTLTIADSFSLMPVALETIAAYGPVAKPPLPGKDEPDEAFLPRCRADVQILRWSVLTLLDWWDDHELGKWSVSGASCGWNSYRHRIERKDVVIDPDREALDLEHAAVYGGKRDVFRVGDLPTGRYSELDFSAAYPTIAATQLLPCKRIGRLTPHIARRILAGQCPYGLVAECEIETDVARWPVRTRDRVLYPVGRYRTVLAGPELAEAERLGCLREIRGGWFYAMTDHMQDWARWALSLLAAPDDEIPGPVKIWGKGAARSVCGKWAQRDWRTSAIPGPPDTGWAFQDVWVWGSDAAASMVGLNGKHYLAIADQESEHEFPAILAYIESHTRLRLAKVIESAPPGSIIQCDTDGVMASLTALEQGLADRLPWLAGPDSRPNLIPLQMESWNTLADPLVIREKRTFGQAVVYGPQHVVIDGKPRFAGMPGRAWGIGPGQWAAQLWPGLSWQIRHGDATGYTRPFQEYLVVGTYAPGWVLDNGAVRSPETRITPDGTNQVIPWPETRWARAGDRLGPDQARWTNGLLGKE